MSNDNFEKLAKVQNSMFTEIYAPAFIEAFNKRASELDLKVREDDIPYAFDLAATIKVAEAQGAFNDPNSVTKQACNAFIAAVVPEAPVVDKQTQIDCAVKLADALK